MTTWIISLVGPIGVIVTSIITWRVAVRKNSGKIDTTEASTLWAEASKMREAYRAEVERQDKEIEDLRKTLSEVKTENTALRTRVTDLEAELKRIKRSLRRKRSE